MNWGVRTVFLESMLRVLMEPWALVLKKRMFFDNQVKIKRFRQARWA